MRFRTLGTAAAIAAALSGCATVKSREHKGVSAAEGMTYFLPTRWVRLTATRTLTDLAAAQRAEETARAALAVAQQENDAAKAAHDSLVADHAHATDETVRTALATQVVAAAAKLQAAANRLGRLKAAYDTAQATADEIEASGDKCTFSAKVELLPGQADPAFRFVAVPSHNILRDDTSKLTVTPAGLLSSANVVAVDRTGDIVVELAGAAGLMADGGLRSLPLAEGRSDCASTPRQVVQIFDPGVPQAALDTGVNAVLRTAEFPVRIVVTQSPPAQGGVLAPTTTEELVPEFNWRGQGALYYRTPVPVLFTIEQKRGEDWLPADAAILPLPQRGPVSYIPMNSAAFVRTVNDVTFTDGVITSWTNERPSEALEVVRLPVKVAQAIVSVPAQLLQLRVNYSSQAEALATKQQSEIDARERLRALETCVAAGGADVVERCLEIE